MSPESRYSGEVKSDLLSGTDSGVQRQMCRVIIIHKSDDIEGLLNILKEIRDEIIKFPGYITSEHLISVKDPTTLMVISTWQNAEKWNAWQKSDVCKQLTARVKDKLKKPLKIEEYNYFVIREKRVWSTF